MRHPAWFAIGTAVVLSVAACSDDITVPDPLATSYSLVSFHGAELPAPIGVLTLNGQCRGEIIRGAAEFKSDGRYAYRMTSIVWCNNSLIRMDTLTNSGRYTAADEDVVITEQNGDFVIDYVLLRAGGITISQTHYLEPPVLSRLRAD